jgi:hypothetical protein
MLVRYVRAPSDGGSFALVAVTWLAAIFTIVSGLQYLVHGMRYLDATDAAREESSENMLIR